MTDESRSGAKQPERFNARSAARLDDPARFAYLDPAAVIDLLALEPGMTLVDFGTGTGSYALEIARFRPDVRVIALDEQPAMLERLNAKLAATEIKNVEPIGPDQLDALRAGAQRVLALNVLHELGDAALAVLTNLLTPAGRAVVIDWNAAVERPHGPPPDHVYSAPEAEQRLRLAGLNVIGETQFPYHYALTVTLNR